MVTDSIIAQIRSDFAFCLSDPRVLGVILYDSYAYGEETPRSDIDICVVMPNVPLQEAYNYIMDHLQRDPRPYDIRFFQELPLYIQGEIIDHGIFIVIPDQPTLLEFLYPFRREWIHQKYRIECIA